MENVTIDLWYFDKIYSIYDYLNFINIIYELILDH